MRGFSIFAPILGTVLIAAAIFTAVSIHQQEVYRSNQIRYLQGKTYVSAFPDYVKWDTISYIIVYLRPWFYTTFHYNPTVAFGAGDAQQIANTIINAIGYEVSNQTWKDAKVFWYRSFLDSAGPGAADLASILHIDQDPDKVTVKIDNDPDHVPTFVVQIKKSGATTPGETMKMKLFDSNIAIPVFYPAQKFQSMVQDLTDAAKNTVFVSGFVAGFVGEDKPWVRVGTVERELKIDTGSVTDPFRPAASKYAPFARSSNDALTYASAAYVKDTLADWISSLGINAKLVDITSVDMSSGEEGIPYVRLICITGDLAEVLSNEGGDTICAVVDHAIHSDYYEVDSTRAKYARITQLTARVELSASSACAPDGSVTTTADITLNFDDATPVTMPKYPLVAGSSITEPGEAGDNPVAPHSDGYWCGPDCSSCYCSCGSEEGCIFAHCSEETNPWTGKVEAYCVKKYHKNGKCTDDYVCGCGSPDSSGNCGTNNNKTWYTTTSETGKDNCASKCETWSRGYLTFDECKDLCHPYYWNGVPGCYDSLPAGVEVCYRASKKEMIKKVKQKLWSNYPTTCKEDTSNEGLCRDMLWYFLGEYDNDNVKVGEPSISGGPAVLSITTFTFEPEKQSNGDVVPKISDVEGQACIAKDGGC